MTKNEIQLIEECLGLILLYEADTPHVSCFHSVEKKHNLKEDLNRYVGNIYVDNLICVFGKY